MEKTCSECKITKPVTGFYRQGKGKFKSECKACYLKEKHKNTKPPLIKNYQWYLKEQLRRSDPLAAYFKH